MDLNKHLKSLGWLAEMGVYIRLSGPDIYEVRGFYKSDVVTVYLKEGIVKARYDEITNIDDDIPLEETLLKLNEYWHNISKSKWDGWVDMNENWYKVKKSLEERTNTNG